MASRRGCQPRFLVTCRIYTYRTEKRAPSYPRHTYGNRVAARARGAQGSVWWLASTPIPRKPDEPTQKNKTPGVPLRFINIRWPWPLSGVVFLRHLDGFQTGVAHKQWIDCTRQSEATHDVVRSLHKHPYLCIVELMKGEKTNSQSDWPLNKT